MGSGKGSPEYWVAVVKPGRVMFEIAGVTEEVAREAIRLASHKMPCKTKFIKREGESVYVPKEDPRDAVGSAPKVEADAAGADSETGGEV